MVRNPWDFRRLGRWRTGDVRAEGGTAAPVAPPEPLAEEPLDWPLTAEAALPDANVPVQPLRWQPVVAPPAPPAEAPVAPPEPANAPSSPFTSTPFASVPARPRVRYHGAMGTARAGANGDTLRRWLARLQRDGVVLAPLLAITLLYFWPLLTSANVIYGGGDITRQFYLGKLAAVAELQAGRLPLWLPTVFCGVPLLGSLLDTSFHPWDLVAGLANLPIPVIFNVGLLLHLIIGQVGAYVWVRQDSLRRLPAALAACWIWNPFVLNSIVIGDSNNIRALLLAPAILAALERGLDRGRFHRVWLVYGALQALQFLTGGWQFAFYTGVVGGLTAAGTFLHRRGREPHRTYSARLRWWLIGTALALTLPMVQLLPGLEYAAHSVRGGTDMVWSEVWGIHPGLLLSYVAPFINPEDSMLVYWGIAPLAFAGIGVVAWRHPRRWWYVGLLVASLVLCIGSDWWISGWLNSLPILRNLRGPFRIALIANLMLVRLAAGGISATLDRIEHQRHVARWALGARQTAAVLIGLVLCTLVWWPRSAFFGQWADALPTAVMWGLTGVALAALLRRPRVWVLAGLLALAPLDWAVHLAQYWRPQDTAAFSADATVAQLNEREQDAFYRVWLRGTPAANYFAQFGIPSVAGHQQVPLRRAATFAQALSLTDTRLLHLTQTRYVLTYLPRTDGSLGPPIRAAKDVEVRIVKGDPVARYDVRGVGRWFPTDGPLWEHMQSNDWDPRTSPVLLEGAPPPTPRALGAGGTVQVASETAAERRLHVQADGPGYLVIADTWFPHWSATVDGEAQPVLRANYLFQAVPVPDGISTVVLRYAPPSIRIGLFTSGMALFVFGLAYSSAHRRDRRGVA